MLKYYYSHDKYFTNDKLLKNAIFHKYYL